MISEIIDITNFKRSSCFYEDINLLITVKSFDLQAIQKRYLASRKNKSGKTGSVERRIPSVGGIVNLNLTNGEILNEQVLLRTIEPRGIDFKNHSFSFAIENYIHIIGKNGETTSFTDPWFSYIHTVKFNPFDINKILITSSGFDLIREYNIKKKLCSFEWLAWENGFDKAVDPETGQDVILTKNPSFAEELKKKGLSYHLISDPKDDHLPTAKRAAFINSATYHPNKENQILATFFHHGKVYEIDKQSKVYKEILWDLKNPHGGHVYNDKIIATSTAEGKIFIKSENGIKILSLSSLEGKPQQLSGLEWIQNTLSVGKNLIAIDSNRSSFVIINISEKKYDVIPFNPDWAVQDLVIGILNKSQIKSLKSLSSHQA